MKIYRLWRVTVLSPQITDVKLCETNFIQHPSRLNELAAQLEIFILRRPSLQGPIQTDFSCCIMLPVFTF